MLKRNGREARSLPIGTTDTSRSGPPDEFTGSVALQEQIGTVSLIQVELACHSFVEVCRILDSFAGGCACVEIRYRSSGPPRYMGNCHCRDCQQATGSADFPAVLVKEVDFKLECKRRSEAILCLVQYALTIFAVVTWREGDRRQTHGEGRIDGWVNGGCFRTR